MAMNPGRFRTTVVAFIALWAAPLAAQPPVGIAVTDLAYTQRVAEYFSAGKAETTSTLQAGKRIDMATVQSSGTYMEGTHSYIEQRELNGFSGDIRSALLRGTNFRLIQGGRFDKGDPQLTKAEQAFNAMNSGKAVPQARQPEVQDVINRIKKGEFSGADYVLFGTLTAMEFRDQFSPIQGTTNASQIFGLDLVAEYSLINTKTFEIKAAFTAQGAGSETKLISNRGDRLPPNRPKVIREASRTLAQDVFDQMSEQLGFQEPAMSSAVRRPMSGGPRGGDDRRGGSEPPAKEEVMRFR